MSGNGVGGGEAPPEREYPRVEEKKRERAACRVLSTLGCLYTILFYHLNGLLSNLPGVDGPSLVLLGFCSVFVVS